MVLLADIRIVDIPDVVIGIEIDEQVAIAYRYVSRHLSFGLLSSLGIIHYYRTLGFSEMLDCVKVSLQSLGHVHP